MKKIQNKRGNLGLITSPFLLAAGVTPVSNLIDILASFSDKLIILTGNAGCDIPLRNGINIHLLTPKCKNNGLLKYFKFIYATFLIQLQIFKLRKDVDVWFFFLGETVLSIPMLTARFLKKDVILVSSGSMKNYKDRSKKDIKAYIIKRLIGFNLYLANRVILYSEDLIDLQEFGRYSQKLIITCEHFIKFNEFGIDKQIAERNKKVGYIGRLSEEKGILNFVNALCPLLDNSSDLKVVICGDGDLMSEVENYVLDHDLSSKIELSGWVPHSQLRNYLNDIKLLIIPSFTEGLPNVMLEAMACGTPVLATSVGVISDIITHNKTGFILETNSPNCIAKTAKSILNINDKELEIIVQNARTLVESEYSYDAAVKRFERILNRSN